MQGIPKRGVIIVDMIGEKLGDQGERKYTIKQRLEKTRPEAKKRSRKRTTGRPDS